VESGNSRPSGAFEGVVRYSETDDGALLRLAHAGDRAAFGELVDRHKDALVAYLARLTGRADEAEDLAQEVFVRLYERARAYRDEGKLRSYLFSIATNLVRSQERQRRRREVLRSIFLAPPNGHRSPPQQQARLLNDELRRRLAEAIADLPLRYRTPLVLYEIEGWSYSEIGELTGCNSGTVKSRIHRGRRRLKECLEPYRQGGH
jgi:RNA polymerase sigma-70 factor, ECF subfamily